MTVALLAPPDDLIALRVAAVLAARGAPFLHLDYHGAQPIAWDGESWLVGGVDLAAMRGIFVRAVPPRGARLDADPDRVASSDAWWRAGLAQTARAELAEACLRDVAARGVRVINVPSMFDAKATQLAAFARAGLPIPRTLITNFTPAARAFAADLGGPPVVKPLLGGAEARLLEDDTPLDPLAPTILQARALGADVRVTVVAGRVISAVEIPSTTLDYRSGDAYARGAIDYRPHALSSEGRELALRAASITGQILSGVDLKVSRPGEYTLIEANSAPVYLDIENKTGAPISEAIVDQLLGVS